MPDDYKSDFDLSGEMRPLNPAALTLDMSVEELAVFAVNCH